jgi:hypothetical protein
MSKLRAALLAGCLCAAMLQACSRSEPPPHNFVQVEQRAAKAEEAGNTLEAATEACQKETERKGVSSVTAIFSRFRKGKAEEDFTACMKERGFVMQ